MGVEWFLETWIRMPGSGSGSDPDLDLLLLDLQKLICPEVLAKDNLLYSFLSAKHDGIFPPLTSARVFQSFSHPGSLHPLPHSTSSSSFCQLRKEAAIFSYINR